MNNFSRQGNIDNMVTEIGIGNSKHTIAILCVECGWEGKAYILDNPTSIFMSHACKLRSQMTYQD